MANRISGMRTFFVGWMNGLREKGLKRQQPRLSDQAGVFCGEIGLEKKGLKLRRPNVLVTEGELLTLNEGT